HQRQPAGELAIVDLRDVQRRVGVPVEGTDVPPLLGRTPPTGVGEQPVLRLGRDRAREGDEARRVAGDRRADPTGHSTSTPAPPRRGSPAAAAVPSGSSSTAAAPPKNRFRRRQRTTS